MSINSAVFLLFTTLSAAAYYITPKAHRYKILLIASIYFYLVYSVKAAVYLLFTILITYAAARWLGTLHSHEKAALSAEGADRSAIKKRGKRNRRRVLTGALVLNFLTLALFKYLNSWLGDLNGVLAIFGVNFSFRPLELLLPLGISFYIFQTSGYLIDAYRGRLVPEKNLLKYTLFVSYFPQMIQGPINRFGELAPQLIGGNDLSAANIRAGIELMLWGMLKKVFIADPLAGAVGEIYANYADYSGAIIFAGAALYCIQLYCDFSGGTDLVRGVSRLFGIGLAENFNRPYLSRSLDEFWRRWHISLGEWMKDYLFYPLALSAPMSKLSKRMRKTLGARHSKLVTPCVATVVVFLVVGIWQGPGLSNIAYGLWNGCLISLSMICADFNRKATERLGSHTESVWFRGFQIFRTCLLVIIGRYFSRADTLGQALGMLKRTVFGFVRQGAAENPFAKVGMTAGDGLGLVIACLVLLTVSVLRERGMSPQKALDKRPALQFLFIFAAVLLLCAFAYLNTDYTAIMYVYENV